MDHITELFYILDDFSKIFNESLGHALMWDIYFIPLTYSLKISYMIILKLSFLICNEES